jgi:S-adenosylmethionine-diacylglycerol 3-amino-3-carboxypropyl transferase
MIPRLREAAALPIAFAQVREDPALDQAVVDAIGVPAHVVMVASGGCTAAALATSPHVASLHLVDPNPAQMALARVKIRMLTAMTPAERSALLGHASMDAVTRRRQLGELTGALGIDLAALGPPEVVAALGPDHAGRYEQLFVALRESLAPQREALQGVLALADPEGQSARVRPGTPLGDALDTAFHEVLALPNLVALFGEGATRNPREPFASHFLSRLRWILGTQPAAGNPFLAQMLLGRFAPGSEHVWLRAAAPARMPTVTWTIAPMDAALAALESPVDVVHLSNILDWLPPDAATTTLSLAAKALRSGGRVIVRQLNSTLDIPVLGGGVRWDQAMGRALLARDRSFFYRAIHSGLRP